MILRNEKKLLTNQLIGTALLLLTTIMLLFFIGCEKKGNLVEPGDGNQTLIISNQKLSTNPEEDTGKELPRYDSALTIYYSKTDAPSYNDETLYISLGIVDNQNYQFVNFGDATIGGTPIELRSDSIASGMYFYHSIFGNHFPNPIPLGLTFQNQPNVTFANSSQINNVNETLNTHPVITFQNIGANQTIDITEDLTIHLSGDLHHGGVGIWREGMDNWRTFEVTESTNIIIIPKEELQALYSLYGHDNFHFMAFDRSVIQTIECTDKSISGKKYYLPVVYANYHWLQYLTLTE
ncbi:hypothetical protein K1X84_00305 [bacterium]|nr:hypothetical protein [bacterium]